MSDKDPDELDFGFGSLTRHDGPYVGQGTALPDKLLGDEDTVPGSPESIVRQGRMVAPPPPQTTNQATMECLRGPCCHLWAMTVRFHSQSDRINIARIRQCNCHYEPTDLTEQNVYHCGQWWPAWLSWIPASLRSLLRPRLRKAWEQWLKKRGYDFAWRYWPDDVFETDRKEQRGQAGLGVGPATFFQGKPDAVKTSDGLYFNS